MHLDFVFIEISGPSIVLSLSSSVLQIVLENSRLESVLKLELNKCHGKPDYTEQNSFCQLSRINEWENKAYSILKLTKMSC